MVSITHRQRQTLQVAHRFIRENGYAPTTRELADRLGIGPSSVTAVAEHLRHLQDAGCITRVPNIARSIVLTDRGLLELGPPGDPPGLPGTTGGTGPSGEAA